MRWIASLIHFGISIFFFCLFIWVHNRSESLLSKSNVIRKGSIHEIDFIMVKFILIIGFMCFFFLAVKSILKKKDI